MNYNNPYESPDGGTSELEEDLDDSVSAWKQLRPYYNGILAFIIFGMAAFFKPAEFLQISFWLNVVLGAIFVNLCFNLGRVLENFLEQAGAHRPSIRVLLFVAGTGFSMFVTFFTELLYFNDFQIQD